jgi:anti-sigma regulatory factor (Ser/Thr protein kinase)
MICVPVHGSTEAPRIARDAVRFGLDGWVSGEMAQDAALVVSELVTNSVLHAELDADAVVLVELDLGEDLLAIRVTDPGSDLVPRLLPLDPTSSHGFGLHVVDDISTSWELALGDFGPDRSQVPGREVGTD